MNESQRLYQIDRLSTWKSYAPSRCRGCWAGCCTLPVEATPADLVRLGLLSEDEAVPARLRKSAQRLVKEKWVKEYRARTGLFTLQQKPNRDCVFLNHDRTCSVYDRRPDVCRSFPNVGPKPGSCPEQRF